MFRVEGGPSAVENGGKSYYKKMQYFTICEEKNPGYRIIELICYCFLTNVGIEFHVHKLNYIIKNVPLIQYKDFVPIYPYLISEGDEIVRACDRR